MRGQITGNRVLYIAHVEPEVDKKTKSGIILPSGIDEETQKKMKLYANHPMQGDVIQVGKDVKICKQGDKIYLPNMGDGVLIEDGVYYNIAYDHSIIYVIPAENIVGNNNTEIGMGSLGETTTGTYSTILGRDTSIMGELIK